MAGSPVTFFTSNYVLLESNALVQHRLGMEAVRELQEALVPVLRVHWVNVELHRSASRMVLAVRQRDFSLVDATNIEWMQRLGIRTIFAFDRHYAEHGLDQQP